MKFNAFFSVLPASAMLLLALTALPAAHAQAPLDLEFNNSGSLIGNPGDTLFFTGVLSNMTGSDVFINGDSLTFNGPAPGLALDDSPFAPPVSLGAMGSGSDVYSGSFFDVLIDPSAQAGTYSGTFLVTGGANGNASDELTDPMKESFSVTVPANPAPVPEASSVVSLGLLLALGGAGLWSVKRRRPASAI